MRKKGSPSFEARSRLRMLLAIRGSWTTSPSEPGEKNCRNPAFPGHSADQDQQTESPQCLPAMFSGFWSILSAILPAMGTTTDKQTLSFVMRWRRAVRF